MDKILISENKSVVRDFQTSVESVVTRGQDLINKFETFQSWKKIQTLEDLVNLLHDPEGYFDEVLLKNVDIKSTGDLPPNVDLVASMFNIRRDDFRSQIRRPLSLMEYQRYNQYIIFDKGVLSVKEDAVRTTKESFRIFATTPKEIELYNYWTNIVDTFNGLYNKGYIGREALIGLQKSLNGRVMYSYETGKLHLSEEILLNEILKLKS